MSKMNCFCGREPVFLPSSEELYGVEYGPVYFCEPCYAWVGCHKGTTNALGRPATKDIREARKLAHAAFDPIWTEIWKDLNAGMAEKAGKSVPAFYGKGKARKAIYQWLADEMGIPVDECHISWFDVPDCKRVIEICRKSHR